MVLLEDSAKEIPLVLDQGDRDFEKSLASVNVTGDGGSISETMWTKSLVNMPLFTIKEIEKHRDLSGKIKGLPIAETLPRGKKFKNERYLKSDSIFTTTNKNTFIVKCKCKARSFTETLVLVTVAFPSRIMSGNDVAFP